MVILHVEIFHFMKYKITFLVILLFNLINAQKIKFVFFNNEIPVDGAAVISTSGNFIGTTDTNGEIEKSLLKDEKSIIINHPASDSETVLLQENSDIYVIKKIRETKIPEIRIKSSDKDFVVSRGYFNCYVSNSGEFNIFVDGIMEYVFDRKTNKLKNSIIIEYRSFVLENSNENRKEVSSVIFNTLVQLPDLKNLRDLSDYSKTYGNKSDETFYTFSKSRLQEKELKFLGYVFHNTISNEVFIFDGTNAKPVTLRNYNKTESVEIKHKSEERFSKIAIISNYYPSEIDYKNKNELSKDVKFNKDFSNYSTNFWSDESYTSIYNFLAKKFKENFVQKPNKQK